jgi:hypothetical protein
MRAGNQHKTVLVLGSRASSLFRSEALYSELQYYGDSALGPEQPQTKRFGSCHHILTQTQFSATEIDQLLRKTLTDVAVELEDLCLARLTVMLGLFDVIVTTHLDSLFEQALGMVGWKEMTHFDVYTPRPDLHSYDPLSYQRVPCRIIKIFGQLATSDYNLPKPGYIKLHKPLYDLLQSTLRRDCLVIGLDPVWDAELYQIFPAHGEPIWYINEEVLDEHSGLAQLQSTRPVSSLVGPDSSYKKFVQLLHWQIFEKIPINLNEQTASLIFKEIPLLREEMRQMQDSLEKILSLLAFLTQDKE